jgi:cyclopropane fatty-acyl-phospholipid synthase-like methyltransferase
LSDHDTTSLASHFGFGDNWRSFARGVDERQIAQAVQGLSRFLDAQSLAGRSFLDIGCGSGLSMLAALRLGAAAVHGVDLDPASVAAARGLLTLHAPEGRWSIEERSVFDLESGAGRYDIVHSWGVLHHTGAMWRAVDRAAAMVADGGVLAIALYRRTPLCGLWRVEKRFYAHASRGAQVLVRGLFKAGYVTALAAAGRNPRRYLATYVSNRGMDWHHDVHDWLGGYPYESVLPSEVEAHLATAGFRLMKVRETHPPLAGLFGTGCDEFLARRP